MGRVIERWKLTFILSSLMFLVSPPGGPFWPKIGISSVGSTPGPNQLIEGYVHQYIIRKSLYMPTAVVA